jgi:hypothetical protein
MTLSISFAFPPLMAAFGLMMSELTVHTTQAAPTRITASQIIRVPGSYVLANDITGTSGGAVIEIQASGVTLNLNGHTINASKGEGIIIDEIDSTNNNAPVVNVHVSNGQIVAHAYGVKVYGSSCLVTGLNITVGASGIPIEIEHGNFNRVHSCVLSATTGQMGRAAFGLFWTSHNTIQNNTLTGVYVNTIWEDDQAGTAFTVVGDNTFSGNEFANPTH